MKADAIAIPSARLPIGECLELAKPRLNLLVVVTTAVGYRLAGGGADMGVLLATVCGTGLVAGGAAAWNQLLERDVDRLMRRTRRRPLPDGRLQPIEAASFVTLTVTTGLAVLAGAVNLLAATVAGATVLLYVGVYTPLKRRTWWATVIGAVPGALPPLIGWAAARGRLDLDAAILFLLVFFWQVPHSFAIGWLCRDDYAAAELPLLPVVDADGRRTARQSLFFASALLPLVARAFLNAPGVWGMPAAAAGILTIGFVVAAARFCCRPDRAGARTLFLASLVYLPLLWSALLVR